MRNMTPWSAHRGSADRIYGILPEGLAVRHGDAALRAMVRGG